MSKILLSQEVKRVQNELRRLSSLLRKADKFKAIVDFGDRKITDTINGWIKDQQEDIWQLQTITGLYKADDPDGNLDDTLSIIANLSVAVSNITSVINRVNALEVKTNTLENTKADKTTTDALQSDINDIVEAILSQEVWKGDFALPLPASDNIVPWSADITNALNGLEAGQKITLKLQNMTGDPVSVFLEESVGDNSFTSESFNGDSNVQVKVTTAQFELNGLRALDRGDYKVIEIRSVPAEVKIDLSNLATIDLSNVNVGVANAGKIARVKTDGGLEYVDEAVKDLTHLTTQDEIFNAVEVGDICKITTNDGIGLFTFTGKTETLANGLGLLSLTRFGFTSNRNIQCTKGNTTTINTSLIPIQIGEATNASEATTKKYVDDAIAALAAKMGK